MLHLPSSFLPGCLLLFMSQRSYCSICLALPYLVCMCCQPVCWRILPSTSKVKAVHTALTLGQTSSAEWPGFNCGHPFSSRHGNRKFRCQGGKHMGIWRAGFFYYRRSSCKEGRNASKYMSFIGREPSCSKCISRLVNPS